MAIFALLRTEKFSRPGWIWLLIGFALLITGLTPTNAQGPTMQRIAFGLQNPRGVAVMPDGRLLVIEAGTGFASDDPLLRTGKLSIFEDVNGDGDYDDEDEITRIFESLASYNALTVFATRHDEVGGPGDIVFLDDGRVFYTQDNPFVQVAVIEVSPDWRDVRPLVTRGATLNAIVYDPSADLFYVAESGANYLIAVQTDGEVRAVTGFSALAHDQQAVPAGLALDPRSGDLLVALFSGQIVDYFGTRLTFMPGDAKIVRVNPVTGEQSDEIVGLTTAVDVAIDETGNIFVVELTTTWPAALMPSFFPLYDPDAPPDAGGYARFTGKVTMYPADGGDPVRLADGLDCPSNITYHEGVLYISTGQGTPGRPIIGPDGLTRIVGEIYQITNYLP